MIGGVAFFSSFMVAGGVSSPPIRRKDKNSSFDAISDCERHSYVTQPIYHEPPYAGATAYTSSAAMGINAPEYSVPLAAKWSFIRSSSLRKMGDPN